MVRIIMKLTNFTRYEVPGIGPLALSRRDPTFFITSEGKNALTCQFDCLSIVEPLNGPFFAACKTRYYKYAALVGMFVKLSY